MPARLLIASLISLCFASPAVAQTAVRRPAKSPTALVRPSFPGGRDSLIRYINSRLRYPEDAHESGVEGRAIIRFMVEANGDISDIEVLRTSGSLPLDMEAKRVVGALPRWKPGSSGQRPVPMLYVLPVTFRLE